MSNPRAAPEVVGRPHPQSNAAPYVVALAYTGAVIGYLPFLTLLLPGDVAKIAGDAHYAALAIVLAIGSVTAGAANLLFGWLSDQSRRRGAGRRGWVAAGLAGLMIAFAFVPTAKSLVAIILAIVFFEIALNAVLAPLLALAAEEVEPAQMGLTTGLFAAGPPAAALVSVVIAASALRTEQAHLAVIAAASAMCLCPLLVMRRPAVGIRAVAAGEPMTRAELGLIWMSRLAVQVAVNVVFADLVYLMGSGPTLPGGGVPPRSAALLLLAHSLPLPIAVFVGRWADRHARLRPSLLAASAGAAAGLAIMAATPGWNVRAGGFLLFATGVGVFLPLQMGSVMPVLPDGDHRGRDLGLLNLANTLAVLIGQGLAWWLATPRDEAALLIVLAGLVVAGGLLMLTARVRAR